MRFQVYEQRRTDEIRRLFLETFSASEGEGEGSLVAGLAEELLTQTDPGSLYCFTANEGDSLVGCIIFTVLGFDQHLSAQLLSPVAVHPEHQRKGIGQQLIRFGLEELKSQGTDLVCTYGDIAFYEKVGFRPVTVEQIPAPFPLSFPHGWLAQSLNGEELPLISGSSRCVEALSRPEYW